MSYKKSFFYADPNCLSFVNLQQIHIIRKWIPTFFVGWEELKTKMEINLSNFADKFDIKPEDVEN